MRVVVLGTPATIVIDDYFPFTGINGSDLAFAKISSANGLYGPFLEKAWAKLSGNFEMIEGGWSGEAIRFFSGVPTDHFGVVNYNAIQALSDWQRIKSADTKNWVMVAGVGPGNKTDDPRYTYLGLARNHAYTLINAYNVTFKNGS